MKIRLYNYFLFQELSDLRFKLQYSFVYTQIIFHVSKVLLFIKSNFPCYLLFCAASISSNVRYITIYRYHCVNSENNTTDIVMLCFSFNYRLAYLNEHMRASDRFVLHR